MEKLSGQIALIQSVKKPKPLDNLYGISVHSDMHIRSVRHRGLLRLIEDDASRELRNDLVRRLRNIRAVLIAAADKNGVIRPPGRRITHLKADHSEKWAQCDN